MSERPSLAWRIKICFAIYGVLALALLADAANKALKRVSDL